LLVAAFVFSKVRNLTAPRRDSDPTRSEVLGIVSVMAGLRVTPADAIRVGLTRLDALEPTWGRVPDGREDLAAALRLRPLSRAILMRGDLAEAARRLSRDCAQGAETRLIRCRWLVRCVGGVSLGAALALLLA
jgi:hypothetical protein